MADDRQARFARLVAEAAVCLRCPRMAQRAAVLSSRNGTLTPRVLFVAEAPGRQGADRTRVPMVGDRSGVAFEALLTGVGLTRADIFITNAVLCSPRSATGANRAPLRSEARNCSGFLERTLQLLDPPVVAALGATALAALGCLGAHGLALGSSAGTLVEWRGRLLVPLYHPSPQVLVSRRSLAQQSRDWSAVRAALEAAGAG